MDGKPDPTTTVTGRTLSATGQKVDPGTQTSRPDDLTLEKQVLDCVGHSVAAVDLDGKLIYWNKFAERLYGWRADEVIGSDARSIAAPQVSEEEARRITEQVLAGETWSGELPLHRRDGSKFEAIVICAPLRNSCGEVVGTVTCSRDVSARADAEAAIRRSEARLARGQRMAKTGNWTWDLQTGQLERSDYLFEMFGASPEEFGPELHEFLQRVHPDDRAIVEENARAAATGERPLDYEHRIVLPDGSVKVIHQRADLTRTEDGRPLRLVGTAQDITDRWQAAQALRASQLSLANAQRIAHLGSWDWDITTGELRWSDEVYRLHGFDVGTEPSYELFMSSVHPDDRNRVRHAVEQALAGKAVYALEHRVLRSDGAVRVMYDQGEVTRDGAGRPIRMSGTIQDITERWEAEDALRRTEERFRAIFEQAPVGISEMTFEGAFIRVNPRFCEFLGYSADELQALTFPEVTHPEDVAKSVRLIGELSAGKRESVALDKRYIHKDGHVLWARSTVSLIGEPQEGRPIGLIAIVENISERIAAEEKLRFQAHMLDSVGEAVMATKPDGTLIYVNRYAESLYGWQKEEALGRNIVELLAAQGPRRLASENAMERLSAGQRASGEYLLRRRDGSTFEAFASATPVINSEGEVEAVIGVSNDVTERKYVQQQLAESEAQLRALTARLQRSREEERTRIAREIHDELGQMLTGLKMDLRWVEHRLEALADGALQPITDRIVAGSELTDAIIGTVQAIAADLRPSVLDTLGLASALEFEARRFRNRTGIDCVIDRPAEMQPLSGDVNTALFRIFQECLTNVARHSAATRVDVKLEALDGDVHLVVRDNGHGAADLERAAAGSLGLLGIRERVGLLSGEVSFSSQEGRGTTVDVRLPKQQLEGGR